MYMVLIAFQLVSRWDEGSHDIITEVDMKFVGLDLLNAGDMKNLNLW